jgi:hypothetical protein
LKEAKRKEIEARVAAVREKLAAEKSAAAAPVPNPSKVAAPAPRAAAAGEGLVARMLQNFDKPITPRPREAQPPRQMNCMICQDNGMSSEGVVCPKGGHFLHRACLDQLITSRCNDYLSHGSCKPSSVACPHNSFKCCVYTSHQLRGEAGGASASCIALLDRVQAAEEALSKLTSAQQLRLANQDAYMCPQCKFGPVAHYACPDVSFPGNKCPQCSFHTSNISGWAKWDGNFKVSV